jgi:hypothetical protein
VNLTVFWRFLLGTCETIHFSERQEQRCSNYVDNIRQHLTRSSRLGYLHFWRRLYTNICVAIYALNHLVPTSLYSATFGTPTASPFNDFPSISDAPLHATCRHSNFSSIFAQHFLRKQHFLYTVQMFLVRSKLPDLLIY